MRKSLLLSAALLVMAAPAVFAQPSTPNAPPAPAGTTPPEKTAPPMNTSSNRQDMRATGAAVIAATPGPASPDIRPGHVPGVGDSFPASDHASNIIPGDTHSPIAPRLPEPGIGQSASAGAFLTVAKNAIMAHQTGRAQEALERAETAMLQRSVPAGTADTPDSAPGVTQIRAARDALAHRDWQGAQQAINAAMSAT